MNLGAREVTPQRAPLYEDTHIAPQLKIIQTPLVQHQRSFHPIIVQMNNGEFTETIKLFGMLRVKMSGYCIKRV